MSVISHRFIAHRRDEWYPVCRASRLGRRPLEAMLFGTPLVVFRTASGVGALVDRCPHRNVPLSLGQVNGECIQCIYHGWEFDAAGECCAVPGLTDDARSDGRRARAFPCREWQGFVWVWGDPAAPLSREPFAFPHVEDRAWTTTYEELDVRASLHATAENALDVPHTAFLHGGLFRSRSRERREIEVIVRRGADRVEAEYVGESRPPGLVAKLLAPGGGDVVHFDRFVLPSVAEVEYRLGESALCISAALAPVEDYRTKLCIAFSYRLPAPVRLARPLLRYFALRIFRQDAWILARQTETIERFGEESYKFTPLDVLGAEIYDLLRHGRAAEGPTPAARSIRMLV